MSDSELRSALTTMYGEVGQEFHAIQTGTELTLCGRKPVKIYFGSFWVEASPLCHQCEVALAQLVA